MTVEAGLSKIWTEHFYRSFYLPVQMKMLFAIGIALLEQFLCCDRRGDWPNDVWFTPLKTICFSASGILGSSAA